MYRGFGRVGAELARMADAGGLALFPSEGARVPSGEVGRGRRDVEGGYGAAGARQELYQGLV